MDPSLFSSIIDRYMTEPQASLLNGIILGINISHKNELYAQLQHVGLLHLVVLSGSNILFLSAVTLKASEIFGKHVSILLTILIIIFFVLFVGPQAPIIRAAICQILTLVAYLLGKKALPLYLLFLSLFLILLFVPSWISSVSLYLSYGASLGLILFSSKQVYRPNKSDSVRRKLKGYIVSELQTTFAAQIFTAPIIFLYFKQISIFGPLANLLVAWTIPPLMILGLFSAVLGKLHFVLGFLPAQLAYGLLTYNVWIIKLLDHLPFGFFDFS